MSEPQRFGKHVKNVGIGVLGFGFMGRTHSYVYRTLPIYYEAPPVNLKLAALCDKKRDRAQLAAERIGFSYYSTDYRDVLKREDVQIVDNCLPNAFHASPSIEAIEHGKDIICEKPLGRNLREAKQMLAVAERQHVKHMVCFNYRYVPAIIRAKEILDMGWIGRVFHFRAVYGHSRLVDPLVPIEWRLKKNLAGGGALADLGIHMIDLALHLVGKITRVNAETQTFVEERPAGKNGSDIVDVEDAGVLLMRFENGALGSIEASRFATGFIDELRIEIHGSEGALQFNLMDFNWLRIFSKKDPAYAQGFRDICVDAPPPAIWPPPKSPKGWTRGHVGILYHFLECVAKDAEPSPSFVDGVEAQRVLEAAYLSADKKEWVDIAL